MQLYDTTTRLYIKLYVIFSDVGLEAEEQGGRGEVPLKFEIVICPPCYF